MVSMIHKFRYKGVFVVYMVQVNVMLLFLSSAMGFIKGYSTSWVISLSQQGIWAAFEHPNSQRSLLITPNFSE